MSQAGIATTGSSGSLVNSVTGANGVTASPTTGNVVVSGINATTSSVGVASFNPADFTVSGAGEVSTIAVPDLHVARYIVSAGGAANGANYTTIASAYAAAVAAGGNQTVFVQPGTYTENITLSPGINLCAFECDALTPNVIIVGKLTYASAGTVSLSGLYLKTNNDYAIAVTGSAASNLNVENCYINCLNHTGIQFSSSSSSAVVNFYACDGNLATTGIAVFAHSSAGGMGFDTTEFSNTGSSTTANTCSSGYLNFSYSSFSNPLTVSSTGTAGMQYSEVSTSGLNVAAINYNSSGAGLFTYSHFTSGSASAISMSGTLQLSQCVVNSLNSHPITGTGNLFNGIIDFEAGSPAGVNTSSSTPQSALLGSFVALGNGTIDGSATVKGELSLPGNPAFYYLLESAVTNVTGNGAQYQIGSTQALTQLFDQTNSCTTAGVFTAPATGIYFLNAQATIYNTTLMTYGEIYFYLPSASVLLYPISEQYTKVGANTYSFQLSQLVQMSAGDTVTVNIETGGEAGNTNTLAGSDNTSYTYFSGYRVA